MEYWTKKERIMQEYDNLCEKIHKLNDYIFYSDNDDVTFHILQLNSMEAYRNILRYRIKTKLY